MTASKDYHAPVNGSSVNPSLTPGAAGAYRVMFWIGVIAAAGWLIGGIIGMSAGSSDLGQEYGAMGFSSLCLQIAVPFLVGAGIVAGLGKREASDDSL